MTPREPMQDETPLSPSEAAYLHLCHELPQPKSKPTAMNANAANGWHVSEPKSLEALQRAIACWTN